MHVRRWKVVPLALVLSALCAAPLAAGDDQGRGRGRSPSAIARQRALSRELPPRYESAFERGYNDGYERGLADGRSGARYDPVESREYRQGDRGYTEKHGSRDAYRTNYRTGFRQGYEDGYRAGTR